MARPERRDVDYFPFYVKDGKTLFILESKYGCKGTGFFTNVLRFLCRTPEHHFQIKNTADKLYFFSCCHCDEVSGLEMLEIMLATGKLSSELWSKYQIIVSPDLLDSIKDAYRNRLGEITTLEQIRVSYNGNPTKEGISDVRNAASSEDIFGQPTLEIPKVKYSKENIYIVEIVSYLNEVSGKSFKPNTKNTIGFINSRLKEGFTVDQFKQVIDVKVGQWKSDPKFSKYIRPETLFGSKFESYLNEKPTTPKPNSFGKGTF